MACFTGIVGRHKSGTGNNQGRQRITPRDNRCFNCKDSHSNSNKLSSLVKYVSPQMNNSVINPPHLSSFLQYSLSSPHKTNRDSRCFNSKDINSKSNEFSSPVIHVPTPLNDSVINPTQLPDLHITQNISCKLLQYLVGLQLIRQIPCHHRPPITEVAIFMDEWLMCLS